MPVGSQPVRTRIRHVIIIAAGMALIIGCGVKFTYNQLDWLVPLYIEDYVTLTGDQKSLLQQRVDERLRWHRDTQLPRYACELQELHGAIKGGLSASVVEKTDVALWNYWTGLMRAVAPDVAELLLTASAEQIDELFDNLERRNREFRARLVDRSAEELERERTQVMTRHIKRWIGKLTSPQQQALAHWSKRTAPIGAARLEQRVRWQRQLRHALTLRSDRSRFVAAVEQLLVNPQDTWPAGYREKLAHNRATTRDLLLELDALLTNVQRQNFLARVDSLTDDLVLLAKAGDSIVDCGRLAVRERLRLSVGTRQPEALATVTQ